MTTPRFSFVCSYMNSVWYKVTDETGQYKIEIRHGLSSYEASIHAEGPDAYYRDAVPLINVAVRYPNNDMPIPPATLAAFNAWRVEEHHRAIDEIRSRGLDIGETAADRAPPPTVTAAAYINGRWEPTQ